MISICIPVRNGGPEFPYHLSQWKQQKSIEEFEIVVLDSGSTDGTIDAAQHMGAKVHSIPRKEFNHGHSRNRLAELAQGDLLVFTVADACPVNADTLQQLTQPLRQEPELAGVSGKQLPRRDADFMASWQTDLLNGLSSDSLPQKKRIPPAREFRRMDFNRQIQIISFDNVCSAMRRSVWEQFPFSPVEFAEDLDWSYRVMREGHPILHNQQAQVYHSHNYSARRRFRHYFVGRYHMNSILDVPAEVFPWTEEEAFAALRKFLWEIKQVGKALNKHPGAVVELKIRHDFKYRCFRAIEKWGPLAFGTFHPRLLRPFPVEWLCCYFNYICWRVFRRCESLSTKDTLFLADQAGAQAAGDFLGQCYYRGRRMNCLSERLAHLGHVLRRHYGRLPEEQVPLPTAVSAQAVGHCAQFR